jgi:beta-glucosidase
MKKLSFFLCVFPVIAGLLFFTGCKKWSETGTGSVRIITNEGGQTLGYDTTSGIKLLIVKGFAFKDLNRNGELDKYEDWRLSSEERAKDLASKMTIEQIAGLMLYSAHQSIPSGSNSFFGAATYNGKPFQESGAKASDLSDQQIKFLTDDNLRHVLVTSVESPEVAAIWNNNVQALCEGIGLGIPANNSSDPRHQAVTARYLCGRALLGWQPHSILLWLSSSVRLPQGNTVHLA